MTYKVIYLEKVLEKDIPALPLSVKRLIEQAVEKRLTINPLVFGKALRYSFKGHRRMRVSDYRIIYRIEPESKTVVIVSIKHRKDIYKTPFQS